MVLFSEHHILSPQQFSDVVQTWKSEAKPQAY